MKRFLAVLLLVSTVFLVLSSCGVPREADPDTGFSVALDLTEEWGKVSDTPLVQGCIIVRKQFAEEHRGALESFLSAYHQSILFAKDPEHLDDAAGEVAALGILPSVTIAKSAIPRSSLDFLSGSEMRSAAEGFFGALSIPAQNDDFYYSRAFCDTDHETVRVGYFPGTTGIGLAHLIATGDTSEYTFSKYAGPTDIIPAVARGEIDIAALPTNAAPNVYKSTGGKVQMAAINTRGVLYICTNGETVTSLSDLSGKTVYVPEQAPKLVLQSVLSRAGVKNVTLSDEYDLDTLPAALAQGIVRIALLPEPKVSVADHLYQQRKADTTS